MFTKYVEEKSLKSFKFFAYDEEREYEFSDVIFAENAQEARKIFQAHNPCYTEATYIAL